jgi:hypothetical protein
MRLRLGRILWIKNPRGPVWTEIEWDTSADDLDLLGDDIDTVKKNTETGVESRSKRRKTNCILFYL